MINNQKASGYYYEGIIQKAYENIQASELGVLYSPFHCSITDLLVGCEIVAAYQLLKVKASYYMRTCQYVRYFLGTGGKVLLHLLACTSQRLYIEGINKYIEETYGNYYGTQSPVVGEYNNTRACSAYKAAQKISYPRSVNFLCLKNIICQSGNYVTAVLLFKIGNRQSLNMIKQLGPDVSRSFLNGIVQDIINKRYYQRKRAEAYRHDYDTFQQQAVIAPNTGICDPLHAIAAYKAYSEFN
jgi:hypothetical protein